MADRLDATIVCPKCDDMLFKLYSVPQPPPRDYVFEHKVVSTRPGLSMSQKRCPACETILERREAK